MDLTVTQTVPFLAVSDIQASVRFYVDGLGFGMTRSWEPDGKLTWCWLQRGGPALMLQEYAPGEGPKGTPGEGVGIYFICEDALAIYHDITARGIEADTPFVGNAMWVVMLADPDGYQLVFESLTDEPEETVYSEHP